MTNITAAIRRSIRSAVRWYVESCSHLDPAAVLGMYGTVMVADTSGVAGGAGRSPGASAKPSGTPSARAH